MPRNPEISAGINRYSRSQSYHRKGKWAIKNKATAQKKAPEAAAPVTKTFGKGTRTIQSKTPRFYPADDVHRPLPSNKSHHRPMKLRESITPGTVLIIVAGRYRGRRVVYLKQLESGLLLVTGPYKVNGVPLRRVNHRYVIATSTKVDISGVEVPDHIADAYFKASSSGGKKGEKEFFGDGETPKKELPAERKADQKKLDTALLAKIGETPQLKAYLGHNFTLRNGQYPQKVLESLGVAIASSVGGSVIHRCCGAGGLCFVP